MTYSLNTLNADRASQPPAGVARFAQEIGLVLGAAGLAFWVLALLSHSLADPAWSTTGGQPEAGNWAGRLGALVRFRLRTRRLLMQPPPRDWSW